MSYAGEIRGAGQNWVFVDKDTALKPDLPYYAVSKDSPVALTFCRDFGFTPYKGGLYRIRMRGNVSLRLDPEVTVLCDDLAVKGGCLSPETPAVGGYLEMVCVDARAVCFDVLTVTGSFFTGQAS